MQRLSLNVAPEKKRRSACNEASHGFSQLWQGCFCSCLIQGYSCTTGELALGTGSPPLSGVCAQGPGTGCCASAPGNTKTLGRKVCILLWNVMWQLSENKVLLKNQMSEVKIKNNPPFRCNVRYWNIYGIWKLACERAALNSIFILSFPDLWHIILVMFFRKRNTSSSWMKETWQFDHYTCFITDHETY